MGNLCRVLRIIELLNQNDELVTAKSADGVAAANAALESLGNLFEQCISDRMAERIVDGFEIIEVDKQQCRHLICTSASVYSAFGAVA